MPLILTGVLGLSAAGEEARPAEAACPPAALAALKSISDAGGRLVATYSISQRSRAPAGRGRWQEIKRGSYWRNGRPWAFHWLEAGDRPQNMYTCFDGHYSYYLYRAGQKWNGTRHKGENWERVFTPLAFGYGIGGFTVAEVLERSSQVTAKSIGNRRWLVSMSTLFDGRKTSVELEVDESLPYILAYRCQIGDAQRSELQVLEVDSSKGRIRRAELRQRFTNPALNAELLYVETEDVPSQLVWSHPLLDFSGSAVDVRTGLSVALGKSSRRQVSQSQLDTTVGHLQKRQTSKLTFLQDDESCTYYEADCACVSAYVLLRAQGHLVAMHHLMRDLAGSIDGLLSIQSLASYLKGQGLTAQIRRLSFDELHEIEGPAIMLGPRSKGPDHFAVIQPIDSQVFLYDPPRGISTLPPQLPEEHRESWSCLTILPEQVRDARTRSAAPIAALILLFLAALLLWRRARRAQVVIAAALLGASGCSEEARRWGTAVTVTEENAQETHFELSCEPAHWRDWKVERVFSSCACLSTEIHDNPEQRGERLAFARTRVQTGSGEQFVWLFWRRRGGTATQEETIAIPGSEQQFFKRLFASEYVVVVGPRRTRVVRLFVRAPREWRPKLDATSASASLSLRILNIQPPSAIGAWTADLVVKPVGTARAGGTEEVTVRLLNPPERTSRNERIELQVRLGDAR